MNQPVPPSWKYPSPDTPGLHLVVSPDNSECRVTWMYRLNLEAGQSEELGFEDREISGAVIQGAAEIAVDGARRDLPRLAGLYIPGRRRARITARDDTVLYLGAGPWDGVGEFFVRETDLDRPVGDIRQVHGRPPYRRDVFMNLDQETPASRIISGFTWGDPGGWTSWPPHQHTRDLEEVYCYFDLPAPRFALHVGYREPGRVESVYPVSSGDFVVVPEGYHPTVAMPGVRSSYFWLMVAHSPAGRRYDLAVNDPSFGDA